MQKQREYIFICTAKDCCKNGGKKLVKSLKSELKASGRKSSYQVIKTKCMSHCKKGPNIIMNNTIHHKVKEADLKGIIENDSLLHNS